MLCSDESDFPSLSDIRSSKAVQRKIDRLIMNLDSSYILQGNDHTQKLKSKIGGPVEVAVNEKVAWQHEYILGGLNCQLVTYD